MTDIAVSIPHGGGSIKTKEQLRNQHQRHAFAYCWLGGTATTGPDNNLFMSVRLQMDPNFAVVDLYTYNLRDTSTHGKVTKRSRLYALGGEAFNNNTNSFDERQINIERVNSTTALLKIPYSTSKSTCYVLEVDESTYDCGVYVFEETAGGLYNYNSAMSTQPYGQQDLFMQQVEDNVVITHEQDGNSGAFLCQRVWDPSAKTLTKTKVACHNGNSGSLDIHNLGSTRYLPTYGTNSGSGESTYIQWGTTSGSSPRYINAVEGRDGKWHFRCTIQGSSNFGSIYRPNDWCVTYIPTSMGGDLATSGWSQSWGATGGFSNNDNYGYLNNRNGRFGVFLPIDVEPSAVSNANANSPEFYMKSWAEIGGSSMIVHVDGNPNTEMNYHSSQTSTSSWAPKQAVWTDSNHFFVHSTSNKDSYWGERNYQKWFLNQYVDETYTANQGYGNLGGSFDYNNMASNAGSQWTKIDDYTLTCNGFNYINNIWAPE
jgi:hypothetical protein